MSKMGQEFEKNLDNAKYDLYNALKQIAKAEGPYSRDHLTHAENIIDAMVKEAEQAISKVEGK